MGTVDDPPSLYGAAMDLSRRAFAGRHYAVAYHALAAALHAAYDLGDADRLAAVGAAAEEQRLWLDEHDPEHELSDRSAARRGTRGLWGTLRQEVQTRQRMLEQHRLLKEARPRGGVL